MLDKYKKMAFGCSRCGMFIVVEARYICPIQQHTGGIDQYAARGRNQIAKAIHVSRYMGLLRAIR